MSSLQEVAVRLGSCVVWVEDGEEGAFVGQDHRGYGPADLKRLADKALADRNLDTYEYYVVELAARDLLGRTSGINYEPNPGAYTAETSSAAKKLLQTCRAAKKRAKLEFEANAPMPEWAKTALDQGWKPPKGWKP